MTTRMFLYGSISVLLGWIGPVSLASEKENPPPAYIENSPRLSAAKLVAYGLVYQKIKLQHFGTEQTSEITSSRRLFVTTGKSWYRKKKRIPLERGAFFHSQVQRGDGASFGLIINGSHQIINVRKGSSAQKAGLFLGDVIVGLSTDGVNYEEIPTGEEFSWRLFKENPEKAIYILIRRGTAPVAELTPTVEEAIRPAPQETLPPLTYPESTAAEQVLYTIIKTLQDAPQDFERKEITLSRIDDGFFKLSIMSYENDHPLLVTQSKQKLCKVGDVIDEINGTNIAHLTHDDMVDLFTRSGDSVTLTLLRKKPATIPVAARDRPRSAVKFKTWL